MKTVSIPGLSARQVSQLVRDWALFRGRREVRVCDTRKSERIVRCLGPFYAPELSFTLKQPQHRQSPFFWIVPQRFGGALPVTPRDFTTDFGSIVKGELRDELFDPEGCVHPLDGGTRLSMRIIEEKVNRNLGEMLREKLFSVFGEQRWTYTLSTDGSTSVVGILHRNLLKTLAYVVSCCYFDSYGLILPQMWKAYLPLLKLWRSGNLPLGFDMQGALELNAPDCKEPPEKKVKAVLLCAEA